MRIPHYLVRTRSGTYHFRLKIPAALQAALGVRVVKRSLATRDAREAALRAWSLAARYAAAIARVREDGMPKPPSIDDLVRQADLGGLRPFELELDPATRMPTRIKTDGTAEDNAAALAAMKVVFASPLPERAAPSPPTPPKRVSIRLGEPGAFFVALSMILLCAALPALAQTLGDLGRGGHLHEEESRFLPGMYHYRKACELFARGDAAAAIGQWTVAAGWAVKEAQYDLGIVYFKGEGVATDRPLGLAWLALAAERKDRAFSKSLAAAWAGTSSAEHARANELFRDLVARYGDDATLAKAIAHFEHELAQITGSRVGMPGHVNVWTPEHGNLDAAVYRRQLQERSRQNFGSVPEGRVSIGEIQVPAAK